MNNFKKFLIIFVSVFSFIIPVHATEIHHKNYNNHKMHTILQKKQKYAYIFNICNFDKNNHNNLINLIVYGTLHVDSNTMSYFTLHYNYHQKSFKFNYENVNIQPVIPAILGVYMKKLGTIEYGQDYNIIYDMNNFVHNNFYNTFDFQKLPKNNLYKNKNSITYRNTNFFGFIDQLTIALQYQYPDCNINRNIHKSVFSHFIRYDCKKFGITIAGAYSADLNHYFHNIFIRNLHYKREKYGLALKYHMDHAYFSVLYSNTMNANMHTCHSNIYINSEKSIDLFIAYYFTPHLCLNTGYSQKFQLHNTYRQESLVYDLKQKSLQCVKYNQLNLSIEYLYKKNVFLYLNDKINLLENKNINLFNLQHIKHIFQMGIVYFF